MEYRRLPLEGLTNARELGGWNTPDGGQTRHRVYLRTEVPNRVTEKDKQFLRDYGVVMDIDLRGSSELEDLPDLFDPDPGSGCSDCVSSGVPSVLHPNTQVTIYRIAI